MTWEDVIEEALRAQAPLLSARDPCWRIRAMSNPGVADRSERGADEIEDKVRAHVRRLARLRAFAFGR